MSFETFPKSSGGGGDWGKYSSIQTDTPVYTSHYATVLLDIAGAGYFAGFTARSSTDYACRIQIDGGDIYYVLSTTLQLHIPFRFNTSIKITTADSTSYPDAWVVLD